MISKINAFVLRNTARKYLSSDKLLLKLHKNSSSFDKYIPLKPGIKRETTEFGEYKYYKITRKNSKENKVIFFVHGGGFCMDAPNFYSNIISSWFCKNSYTVYYPVYRLSPDFKPPVQYEDVFEIYKHFLNQIHENAKISVVGDSAGGAIALALVQLLIKHKVKLPESVVCLSPAGDIDLNSESTKKLAKKDQLFSLKTIEVFKNLILDKGYQNKADIFPAKGSFKGFPPVYLLCSKDEILKNAALDIKEKMLKDNAEFIYKEEAAMPHDFPLFAFLPEAKKARKKIISFIEKYY